MDLQQTNFISFRLFLLEHPSLNPYSFTTDRFIRNITRNYRLLPDFLIIGYHKCGTTSLYNYLIQHPNIAQAGRKEIQYFSMSYWRGINWYKSYFPTIFTKKKVEKKTNTKFITGEASAQYIYHPYSLERIKKTLPDVKLILLLRNPIDRAFSHYKHLKDIDAEKIETFEEVIELDSKRHEVMFDNFRKNKIKEYNHKFFLPPYISMGKYVIQIEKLFKIFPKENIIILESKELRDFPEKTTNRVFDFLNLSVMNNINFEEKNIGRYPPMNSDTRTKLVECYRPYNKKLEKLLNRKFDWDV